MSKLLLSGLLFFILMPAFGQINKSEKNPSQNYSINKSLVDSIRFDNKIIDREIDLDRIHQDQNKIPRYSLKVVVPGKIPHMPIFKPGTIIDPNMPIKRFVK